MGYLLAFELHNEPVSVGDDGNYETKVSQKMASYRSISVGKRSDDSSACMVAAAVERA